ncbi:MAG: cyclophilin-like fold protein [Hyphomicrobiaceae bacterium]
MREVVIQSGAIAIRARLLDTPTAQIVWRALPLFSTAEIWGKEVHFDVPLEAYLEADARQFVTPGDIAYAPDNDAISIAYGKTPTTRGNRIRLWSPSNIFAVAYDDVAVLAGVPVGAEISIRSIGDTAPIEASHRRRRHRRRR